MKASRLALVSVLLVAVLAVVVIATGLRTQSRYGEPQPSPGNSIAALPEKLAILADPVTVEPSPSSNPPLVVEPIEEKPAPATNKLERLAQIREAFRVLANGDKTHALHAAKQIADETERETALLTLVTEWTQGELGPARLRAQRIASFGLEAGLGLELGKHPELASLWADEMTEGAGRTAVLQQAARFLVDSDPAAAFALTQKLPEAERRVFTDSLFANWAQRDTDAAIKWAEQLPDAARRDEAFEAIRSVAPVGIGAALGMQDGYPVILDLILGTPAQLSGQLNVGDRIIALAQANGPFVDIHEAPLADVVSAVRGAPKTLLQLKVLSANAPPNTPPKTVLILRDQIKFKK